MGQGFRNQAKAYPFARGPPQGKLGSVSWELLAIGLQWVRNTVTSRPAPVSMASIALNDSAVDSSSTMLLDYYLPTDLFCNRLSTSDSKRCNMRTV